MNRVRQTSVLFHTGQYNTVSGDCASQKRAMAAVIMITEGVVIKIEIFPSPENDVTANLELLTPIAAVSFSSSTKLTLESVER